jgi:hypothetical protein
VDDDTRVSLIMRAIGQIIEQDGPAAADTLTEIGENSDGYQMFGVCCAMAEAAKHLLPKIFGPQPEDTFWVLESLVPGGLTDDPAKAFSVRFIVAWANGDRATAKALFDAAICASTEEYVDSVSALLIDVGGFARLALEIKDEQSS